ncbi:MAG: hypothetical protein JJ897_18000 [Marinibacterium sp.]|nr:hypothetical protein [Marinibacterium sp.]
MAKYLDISPRTVEVHRSRVFEKMQVRGIADLFRILAEISHTFALTRTFF